MANLKQALAALSKKQADLDLLDDQLSGMPEMGPDAPADGSTSPEFDLLSQKREELEEEIRKMREGVQLISEWEKFKGGQWSDDVKRMLGEIDTEITGIAGGDATGADDALMAGPGPSAPLDMPPAPAAEAPLPEPEPLPDAAPAPEPPPAPEAPPVEPPPPAAAPVASAKSPVSKKTNYQSPEKKGISATSNLKKDGSTMANQATDKPSLKEKLAEVKSKREAIKKEAQKRVAAAWTIAKTMLPDAPPEKQKAAAVAFLQMATPVLNAMVRQTAKNAHYTKLAETFKQVHKVELNDLMEDPSVLNAEKKAVESEIKGEPKNAAAEKTADDRKDAGPQPETYDDGRGAGSSKHTEPKEMDAGGAAKRPENTVNKSEGGDKVASAHKEACDCKSCGCGSKKADGDKTADEKCADCKDGKMCAKHASADPKAAAEKKEDKKEAAVSKKADEPLPDMPAEGAPAPDAPGDAPAPDAPPAEEPPAELPPAEEPPAEGDSAAEVLTDEKKMLVEEKIEEAQEAISALEKEILEESAEGEELDYSKIFDEENMDEKVSSLANEGEKQADGDGNGEEYFAPSASGALEASLDEPQMASMDDFFSLKGSDSDPLAHLIAGEIKSAADVAGVDIVPSSTGEAANHFESESATGESRDNESDHDGDLFAEAIEDAKAEDGGFKRVKQDETNELEAPKAAKAKEKANAPVIKKLKPVVASSPKPIDIASALFGDDEN